MSSLRLSNVHLPANLLCAIGHVAALWGRLEYIIDGTISTALTLPGAPKINPKLIIPFAQRLDLLDRLSGQFLTDHTRRDQAATIIADLKLLIGQRNLIVHGAVGGSKQRRKRQVVYWFRRIAWDTQPRIVEKRALTVAGVQAFAAKLSDHVAFAQLIELFFWGAERASRDKGAS